MLCREPDKLFNIDTTVSVSIKLLEQCFLGQLPVDHVVAEALYYGLDSLRERAKSDFAGPAACFGNSALTGVFCIGGINTARVHDHLDQIQRVWLLMFLLFAIVALKPIAATALSTPLRVRISARWLEEADYYVEITACQVVSLLIHKLFKLCNLNSLTGNLLSKN